MAANITSRRARTFERMIAAGEFLEWAEVFGNYYGTAMSALSMRARAGKDLLLDIDVQGALQVMQQAAGGGFDLHSAAEPGGAGDAAAQSQPGRGHDATRR